MLWTRSDSLGVTSIIRDLNIDPKSYTSMLNFFRSEAWHLQVIINQWIHFVSDFAPIFKVDDMTILIGDGVKQSKEARKMPGVKRLHQESEISSKAEYIFGHMFGGIGVLTGDLKKLFCVPLSIKLHDGVKIIRNWKNSEIEADGESHIVQMIIDGFNAAKTMGQSILLLDRYFLSVK